MKQLSFAGARLREILSLVLVLGTGQAPNLFLRFGIRNGLLVLVLGHRIFTLFLPVPRLVLFKSQLTHTQGNSHKCFTKASFQFEHA